MLIDEPPVAAACSGCQSALSWIYSQRTGKWVAIIRDSSDATVMRVHQCRDGIPPARDWRTEDKPGDPVRGRALVDAAIAEARAAREAEVSL
jgi:hypothetical protein